MDIIFLHGLEVEAIIGIYDWERITRQTVVVDLEMGTDIRRATQTDDIADTLSYETVAKRLIDFIGDSEFFLAETLAEQIAVVVLNEFSLPWVKVVLHKPGAVRGAKDVGIVIERHRCD